jgi:hypothetical protein
MVRQKGSVLRWAAEFPYWIPMAIEETNQGRRD